MFVLTSEYESFSSKNKNKLLTKFVSIRLLQYFQRNTLETYFRPEESTYIEMQKALKGEEFDENKKVIMKMKFIL